MKKKLIILFTLFSINSYAEYPYIIPTEDYNNAPVKSFEVTHMSATKSQDDVGLCYGFSTTALLENFRCRSLKISCFTPKEQLSVLDVSSFADSNRRAIIEGGLTREVLSNFAKSDRKVVKEECLNYSQLLAKNVDVDPKDPIAAITAKIDQGGGISRLTSAWNKYKHIGEKKEKMSKDCVHCLAVDIKNNMFQLKTSVDQIENALKFSKSLEEFMYQSVFPKECLEEQNKVEVPAFTIRSFPENGENYNPKILAKKLEQVLLNDIPVEMSMCTVLVSSKDTCPKGQGHSITMIGIRENCSEITKKCKKLVRIRNSYGWDWQKKNNQGWFDLDTLMEASFKFNNHIGKQFTWLEEPGRVLEKRSL